MCSGSKGVFFRFSLVIFFICLGFISNLALAENQLRVVKDSYVVELRQDHPMASANIASAQSERAATVRKLSDGGFSVQAFGRSEYAKVRKTSKTLRATLSNSEAEFVPFDPNDDTCINLVNKLKIATACSPDYEVKASETANDTIPWGVQAIDAPKAWDKTTGSNDVVVAILDTGVDYRHPDLAANMWVNPGEISGNHIDDDGDGYADDVHGINTYSNSGDPMDDNGHGTHVTGTIGAIGNNSLGVAGINWRVKIIALKFLSASGSGSVSDAVSALNYLIDLKNRGVNIRVVNNSWGGGGFSQPLYDVMKRAGDAGIIMAVAAGNESNDNDATPAYPASFDLDNIISVAAIDQNNNLASFSNYGANSVDIAAPGVSVLSLAPSGRYATMSGTSMATPHVTGSVALLLAAEPNLTNEQAIQRLYDSGVSMASLAGVVKSGRILNIGRAVAGETNPIPPSDPPSQTCPYTVSEVAFNPDRSADSSNIVMDGDELEFATIPFSYSFYGKTKSRLIASLNGIAYTKQEPGDMDYQNGSKAPLNSIAALQTDLLASGSPYGLRYKVSGDSSKLTVYWNMHHYSSPNSGQVQVWLTIEKEGKISSCVQYPGNLGTAISIAATMGISAESPATAATFASNSSKIKPEICVEYVPQCQNTSQPPDPSDGAPRVTRVILQPSSANGEIKPGERMKIAARGSGNGAVTVYTAIDGKRCSGQVDTSLVNGKANLRAVVPSALRNRIETKISIRIGNARAYKFVYGDYRSRNNKKSLSKKAFDNICSRLNQSITK